MYYSTTYPSPVGLLTLASDGTALTGVWIENQKYHGDTIYSELKLSDNLVIFQQTKQWLTNYFAGKKPAIDELTLHFIGSDFQKIVWEILCEIPYNEVTTYGEIAKKVAKKRGLTSMSSQAVGGAVGHNPISIIVPCHRVVGSNGSLTGYAGGLAAKISLLNLEGLDTDSFFVPTKGTAL
ncbi:methylated-DNA--[protein]-cysteine S-methyltransferase [Enterococcus sp. LJL99]